MGGRTVRRVVLVVVVASAVVAVVDVVLVTFVPGQGETRVELIYTLPA